MRRAPLFIPVALSLLLAACARAPEPKPDSSAGSKAPEGPKAATAAALKPLEKKQFGAAITEKSATSLTSLVKEPSKFTGQTVTTEGLVSAVCKSMGCWMEIADDSGQAHIKMAGHSFFVPRDASGHRARVQGKVLPSGTPDTCTNKDSCRENAEHETGRVAKVEIEATGVEFID